MPRPAAQADDGLVEVKMLTNLFQHSRMSGVPIPAMGETVRLCKADAESLCRKVGALTHAEIVTKGEEPKAPADK